MDPLPLFFLSSSVKLFLHGLAVFGSSQFYNLAWFLKIGGELMTKVYKDSNKQIAATRVCQAMKNRKLWFNDMFCHAFHCLDLDLIVHKCNLSYCLFFRITAWQKALLIASQKRILQMWS